MNKNKRPASSPPPEAAPTRPPPFRVAGAQTLNVPGSQSQPEWLVGALMNAVKSFNHLAAMLTAQHANIEALTDRRVLNSFSNSLGKMAAAWQQALPMDLKTSDLQLRNPPVAVTSPPSLGPPSTIPPPPNSLPPVAHPPYPGMSGSTSPSSAANPPSAPSHHRPSYASVAKLAGRSVLSVARAVASALPSASPNEVIGLASKLTSTSKRPKPKIARAPKGVACAVTLRPLSPLDPAQLPLDHHLGNGWVSFITQSYPDQLSDGSLPPLRTARWIPGIGFRFNFSCRPSPVTDEACLKYLNSFPSLRSTTFSVERFRFRNSVFYRRVSLVSRDTDWRSEEGSRHICDQISNSPIWKDVPIIGTPRLYFPPQTPQFAVVYVDFYDNARGSNLKAVVKDPIYLGATGSLCRAKQALDVRPAVQRCSICQRWGHSAAICQSMAVRCAVCAGPHDERQHAHLAPTAAVACFNCKGAHRADSHDCPFYIHRRDPSWISDHQPSTRSKPTTDGTKKKKGKKRAKQLFDKL